MKIKPQLNQTSLLAMVYSYRPFKKPKLGRKEKRLAFSVTRLKNEGEMHLMFRKIYAAITPRQAAIGKSVAYHPSLHKNHPVIHARTSPTTFSINLVNEFLLEKSAFLFSELVFTCVIQNISIFPHTKHEFLFFLSSHLCSVFVFYYEARYLHPCFPSERYILK